MFKIYVNNRLVLKTDNVARFIAASVRIESGEPNISIHPDSSAKELHYAKAYFS